MRVARWLYTAALLCATPAASDVGAALEAAKAGEMAKLVVHDAPRDRLETPFTDGAGVEVAMANFEGRVVLVNFWATWCPPCLKEMPALDRLAAERSGEDFAVVAISTDRGDAEKPRKWLAENGIEALDLYHDARLRLAQEAALLGQPTTLILDRQGREVARYTGEAHWDGADAWAAISAVIDAGE